MSDANFFLYRHMSGLISCVRTGCGDEGIVTGFYAKLGFKFIRFSGIFSATFAYCYNGKIGKLNYSSLCPPVNPFKR